MSSGGGKRRKQAIKAAQSQWWLCYHCMLPIDMQNLSRDHLVPKSEGGRGVAENIVASCHKCNMMKGSRKTVPEGYIRIRQRQYYRSLGIAIGKLSKRDRELYPGFGTDVDGRHLFAPQFGIL